MAGVKEFTVGVSHTVNLGDYEFMRVEAEVRIGVDDDDSGFEELRRTAQEALSQLLSDSFHTQRKPAWFAQIPRKRSNL